MEETILTPAVLVAVRTTQSEAELAASFAELARLVESAGGSVFATVVQNKEKPDVRTYIGRGKVTEVARICGQNALSLVVFDHELTPSQIRNLEADLTSGARYFRADAPEVRVIDRSMLILDIFALHAESSEGKLQVELAQLAYTVPRLSGQGASLSRQGGGIGSRGPGESKLETDRRHIERRMAALRAELAVMEKNRQIKRKQRDRAGLARIAIAGYTNAGKSTLLNRLTDAGILAADKLFATLDPTTRKLTLPCGEEVLLTDTVGFIRNLPHHLVHAFRSTLEEVASADMILILIDSSDPEQEAELRVTESLLADLGAGEKPVLYVYNKCDLVGASRDAFAARAALPTDVVFVSAATGEGIDDLLAAIERMVHAGKRERTFRIPNSEGGVLHRLYGMATVLSVDYGADGMVVRAVVDRKTEGMLAAYLVEDET